MLESNHGDTCRLWGDHLIGRAPEAALHLEHASISWRHASLRWTGKRWELRDLGSLNGTFLDGSRIEPGMRTVLRVGSELRFGEDTTCWVVNDDSPPWPCAVALDTGERLLMQDGMISLPSGPSPEVAIYRDPDGRWLAEHAERVWQPSMDEPIEINGREFRFEPGGVVFATSATQGDLLTPATLALDFKVSRNEEHVDITIVHGGQRVPLRPRAHSYMLLTLARLRVADQERGGLSPASHGWVEQDRLLKMLATSASQLSLDIYRARRQFGDAGVADSAHLIERRPDSRELRLGVTGLSVQVA